jgi:hypothetical protein
MRSLARFRAAWLIGTGLVLAAGVALATATAAEVAGDAEKGALLFEGDELPEGWSVRQWDDVSKKARGSWTVEDGVLHGGQPRGTWLMFEKEVGDFELEFEFKLGPMGNSGLALRAPMKGDPAFDGMELQMSEFKYNEQATPAELTGGVYRAIAPTKDKYKSGEWNKYRIVLQGARLQAWLNGEQIHDVDLDQQEQVVKRHDETDAPPIKDRPRRGHIGFQNLSRGEGDVLIRNARFREL